MKESKLATIFMSRIFIIVIVFIITSCNQDNFYKSDLKRVKAEFPDSLINHFPNEADVSYYLINNFPSIYKESNRYGSLLVLFGDKRLIDEIGKIGEPINILDSIFIPGNDEYIGTELNNTNLIPLPNFNKIITNCKVCEDIEKLNIEDLEFYYIDTGDKSYLNKEFLSEIPNSSISNLQGYSRGIAISHENNYILYWFELW